MDGTRVLIGGQSDGATCRAVARFLEELGWDFAAAPAALEVAGRPEDIAVVGYTGGTTGRQKGVVHTHSTLLASVKLGAPWRLAPLISLR